MRTVKEPPIPRSFKKEDYERAVKAVLNTKIVQKKNCNMEVDISEDYYVVLRKVFNPVIFETDEKQRISVAMRDGRFEIRIQDKLLIIRNGELEFPLGF